MRPAAAASGGLAGVIVPLYSYPGDGWNNVVAAKTANPSVPVVAVINPNNGPGESMDPNYASGIKNLQSAGIVVLGYVYTSYAGRSMGSAESDILAYKTWYGVDGIFFDEMSNVVGHESYYSSLNGFATSLGLSMTFGNPGSDVPSSYVGTVGTIIIYENSGEASVSYLGGWHTKYSRSNFASISYGVGSLDESYVQSASNYLGYVYVTDEALPNPYGGLPSYLGSLIAALRPAAPSASIGLKIQSDALDGTPINGLWTTITSGGVTTATGYTPVSYGVTPGVTYVVTVSDYGSYVFDHWNDGSTNPVRVVTSAQAMTLTAYFRTLSLLTVQSVGLNGVPISGLWTVVRSGGSVVAEGFTPFTYTPTSGAQYVVTMSDYQNHAFNHWNDGTTSRSYTVMASGITTLTAYYSPVVLR